MNIPEATLVNRSQPERSEGPIVATTTRGRALNRSQLAVLLALSGAALTTSACSSADTASLSGGRSRGYATPSPARDAGSPPTTPPANSYDAGTGDLVDPPLPSPDAGVVADTGTPPGLSIASVTLVDTSITDVVAGSPVAGFDPLANAGKFSVAAVGTQLSLRANVVAGPPGSVSFVLDGTSHTENATPYTLCGDDGAGTITNCNLTQGAHTLVVTPFTVADLGGTAGTPLTINFTVDP